MTNYSLVLWILLGLLTCKNRLPYNLYYVAGDVKHCTKQSNPILHSSSITLNFYRAMHFSAKRGIAIACRLSVCNVGELWSHRLEFFENNFTIS